MKILIVEDEAIIALMLEEILSLRGHEVMEVARTAGMAYSIVDRCRPDLALLDIRLADGSSGVDVAYRLKQTGVPSIFMTGSLKDAEDNRDAVVACIAKPFDQRDIERAIRRAEDAREAELALL